MRADDLLLGDILDATTEIAGFIQEAGTKEQFISSSVFRSAVLYQLIVVGEAVTKLGQLLKERHPEIPWVRIKGFRNFAVHEYFSTDWDTVWNTAVKEASELRTRVIQIISSDYPSLMI